MRVLVVGGYGLLGGYVTAALAAAGHHVVGAGRSVSQAKLRFPYADWERAELGALSAAEWRDQLRDVDGVVNCAGALQASPRDSLQAVHVEGLVALAEGSRLAGVRRLIHISAVGVDENADAFASTKLSGEQALACSGLDWIILRPGLILAPAAFGGTALLRGLAAFPLFVPAIHSRSRIQVVGAGDVAHAVLAAFETGTNGMTIDLVAPGSHSLEDLLRRLRAWLGLPPAPVLSAPAALAQITARIADGLAYLGWRSPMRSTAVRQLQHGVVGKAGDAALLGIRLRTLEELLASMPSGVQERWFAKLYFAKPLALFILALFWLASGLIGAFRAQAAAGVLVAAGVSPQFAAAMAWGGAAVDVLLGAAVCLRGTAPWALRGMVAVSATYLIGASLWRPDLWLDPLGVLVKVLPASVLALVVLAIMDER